jgi:nitrite reductase (cytochrome c-552)
MRRKKLFLTICCLSILILTSCANNTPAPDTPPKENDPQNQILKPEDMIFDPEEWKTEYPLIYDSFMKTSTMGDDVTEDSDLGGSHPLDYLKEYPNIAILYEGIGFSKEYYQARGHYYALEDVINISRPKPGASCLACKSAEYESLNIENGESLFSMDFQQTVQDVEFGITCYNCHRNNPEEGVQITSPHFNNAVEKLSIEPSLGTQACAQCHVEYYFDKDSKEVILPWDKGISVGEIESYYDEIGFSDWEHPRTGTPLIKVQHPEFEMYSGSLHDSIKVSCADCHMPTMVENNTEYKSHWATSPLKTPEESCGKCHSDQLNDIVLKVEEIQKNVHNKEAEVSDMLVKLTMDFAKAIEDKKLDEDSINKLRELHRKAQYRWDFVFVENSTGFHNEEKANESLDEAKTFAQEALNILEGFN